MIPEKFKKDKLDVHDEAFEALLNAYKEKHQEWSGRIEPEEAEDEQSVIGGKNGVHVVEKEKDVEIIHSFSRFNKIEVDTNDTEHFDFYEVPAGTTVDTLGDPLKGYWETHYKRTVEATEYRKPIPENPDKSIRPLDERKVYEYLEVEQLNRVLGKGITIAIEKEVKDGVPEFFDSFHGVHVFSRNQSRNHDNLLLGDPQWGTHVYDYKNSDAAYASCLTFVSTEVLEKIVPNLHGIHKIKPAIETFVPGLSEHADSKIEAHDIVSDLSDTFSLAREKIEYNHLKEPLDKFMHEYGFAWDEDKKEYEKK